MAERWKGEQGNIGFLLRDVEQSLIMGWGARRCWYAERVIDATRIKTMRLSPRTIIKNWVDEWRQKRGQQLSGRMKRSGKGSKAKWKTPFVFHSGQEMIKTKLFPTPVKKWAKRSAFCFPTQNGAKILTCTWCETCPSNKPSQRTWETTHVDRSRLWTASTQWNTISPKWRSFST